MRLISFFVVPFLLLFFLNPLNSQTDEAPWPMLGHDARNTGRSPYLGPEEPRIKWRLNNIETSIYRLPLIGKDG